MVECPSQSCNNTCIGETARSLPSGIEQHGGKCEQSNMIRHSVVSGHNLVKPSNFKILTQIWSKDMITRKIAEALLIQKYKPTLNTQGASSYFESLIRLIFHTFGVAFINVFFLLFCLRFKSSIVYCRSYSKHQF